MQVNRRTRTLAVAGMLAAISAALMFLEFPLPLLPSFLQLDFSDIPVLIGSFVLGPLPALAITFVKDIIVLLVTRTGGGGELADFLVTGSMAVTAGFIYKAGKNRRVAVIGGIAGIVVMTVVGAISNLYIILPFYTKIMPIDAILKMCAQVNPLITSVNSYVLYAVVPFNILKGAILTVVTLLVHKRLAAFIAKG